MTASAILISVTVSEKRPGSSFRWRTSTSTPVPTSSTLHSPNSQNATVRPKETDPTIWARRGEETMGQYRLHCFAESGNSFKVAAMLNVTGQEWEPVWIPFFKGGARTPEFLALNQMGEAPVLEQDGVSYSQSGAILTKLARETGQFGGQSDEERDEILRWLLWDNHKLTAYLATHRFMTRFLPEEKRDPATIGFLQGRAKAALQTLETRLGAQDYVAVPTRPTIADLSVAGYLFYPGETVYDAETYPNIATWAGRLSQLRGWHGPYDLMPGAPT